MPRLPFEEYKHDPEFATLDDDWLSEVETDPAATDWFVSIAEGLITEGADERARELVELWDEELQQRKLWQLRLDCLRRFGTLICKSNRLQREVVRTLEAIWADKPNLNATIEWAGLKKNIDAPGKVWDRITRVDSVLRFDVGVIVALAGQGVGRVVEVNLVLETLKLDFEKKSGVTLGFRAAAKMLLPLPPGHPLRLKLEDPEGLARLRDEQPAELLRAVLEIADHPLSASEVRDALAGIVDEKRWTSWWAAARRHPQVVTTGSGRQSYRWETSASGALDAVRKSFRQAAPRKKMDLFRKHSDRDGELGSEFSSALAKLAVISERADPGLSWELLATLERAGGRPAELDALAERLIAGEHNLRPLITGILDRTQRERALGRARELRADWPAIYRDQMLQEQDQRLLTTIAKALRSADQELHDRLLDDLVTQPRRAPATFVWIAEQAAVNSELRARAPLRLLQQILAVMSAREFAIFRSRLRPLTESGGTIPRLLAQLEEEQAAAALDAIERAQGLEEYQREPLLNAVRLRFSALAATEDAAGPLYATASAIDAKRAELKRLAEVEIPTNRKAIEEARALGDLRENFEYKSARQRHEYLNSRVAALHRDLGRVRPIDFEHLDLSEVRIGARIKLAGDDGRRRSFALLGPWESQPEVGTISYESDLGRKLLSLKIGDNIQVGERRFVVDSIESAQD